MTAPNSDDNPAGRRRVRTPDDDLLTGFSRPGRRQLSMRAFFATTIAGSLLVWDLTFTLGAYHTVFYWRLYQIVVVSTVLLLGSVVLRREVNVGWSVRLLLGVPLVWVVLRAVAPVRSSTGAVRVLDLVLVLVTLASVPVILVALTRIVTPDYFELPARRLKAAAVAIVVLVGVSGFLIGQFNDKFTSCHDYVVAGDDTPAHCGQTPTRNHSP